MPKVKMTPRASGTQHRHVSAAAKRPDKTTAFLDQVDGALSIFNDEVMSMSAGLRRNAYTKLATTYQQALSTIWGKASDANVQAVIKVVDDDQLHELRRMTQLLE